MGQSIKNATFKLKNHVCSLNVINLRRPFPMKNQSQQMINILLAGVVIATIGFIVWKFQNKKSDQARQDSAVSSQLVVTNNAETISTSGVPIDRPPSPLSSKAAEIFKSIGVETSPQTSACKNGVPRATAITYSSLASAEHVKNGTFDLYLGDRILRCYEVGAKLDVIVFDFSRPNEAFASYFGKVVPQQIFEFPTNALPDALFDVITLPKATILNVISNPTASILFIGKFEPTDKTAESKLPFIPRSDRITSTDLAGIQKQHRKTVILDLRTRMNASPIADAIPFNVELSADVVGKSLFTVTKYQLVDQARFDRGKLKELTSDPNTALVLIGEGERDMRPAAIASELFVNKLAGLYWLPLNN